MVAITPKPYRIYLRDSQGFSTLYMAIALLLTLSLIFTTAQVYRVTSASADIQEVADATALAAANEVAEFMIAAYVCDAVVLSLTLTGITAIGLGVVALCTPFTASLGERLISLSSTVFDARDSFSSQASNTLNTLQKALPLLAALNAASIASDNSGGQTESNYLGIAFLVPSEGLDISIASAVNTDEFLKNVQEQKDAIKEAGDEAEELAKHANEIKQRAFERDCGANPSYCMYERAATLAGLSGADNPLYSSVDTWSFSVALKRAQAYYATRQANEAPTNSTVEEQVRSALRQNFYRYASVTLAQGYVYDDEESFDAFFPRLPRTTAEMRETSLYTETIYPITVTNETTNMHAWEGCPAILGTFSLGSISDMEAFNYETCTSCKFTAASLGRVASASTSIENGFEYHYDAVAREAELYQQARDELDPVANKLKEQTSKLLDQASELISQIAAKRIKAQPPGSYGVIALVVDTAEMPAATGFESSFISSEQTLGLRAAISGATLIVDEADDTGSLISSLLDGLADTSAISNGTAGFVLDAWSALLQAYTTGSEAIGSALERVGNALSLHSESGLGTWALKSLKEALIAGGLEPATLDALKPVVVNTEYIVRADQDDTFASRFLAVKQLALDTPNTTKELLSSVLEEIGQAAFEGYSTQEGLIEIARIEPLGSSGPSIPLTISLPEGVDILATTLSESITEALTVYTEETTEVSTWE